MTCVRVTLGSVFDWSAYSCEEVRSGYPERLIEGAIRLSACRPASAPSRSAPDVGRCRSLRQAQLLGEETTRIASGEHG